MDGSNKEEILKENLGDLYSLNIYKGYLYFISLSGNEVESYLNEESNESVDSIDNKIYKVGLQQFHFNNLEDFFAISLDEVSENGKPVVISSSCRGIFDEYLSNHQNLDREITGRLVII